MYPHEFVLEVVYRIFAKYDKDSLLKKENVYLDRSVIEFFKVCVVYDIERVKNIIQKYFNLFFTEPDKYYDRLLMRWMLELLLENNENDLAIELYNKYLEKETHLQNIIINLQVLQKFPQDYAIEVLKQLEEKILAIEDSTSLLRSLVYNSPLIDDDHFVEFCLEIAEYFPKESAFTINTLFHRLAYIKPVKYENELISFLEKKIAEGFHMVGALNILFFIGTDKSIEFLTKYLDDENRLLRDKAFSSIKYIFERQNKLWYNREEVLDIN